MKSSTAPGSTDCPQAPAMFAARLNGSTAEHQWRRGGTRVALAKRTDSLMIRLTPSSVER